MRKPVIFAFGLMLMLLSSATLADEHYREVKQALDHFLYGASIGSPEIHDRFWASELVYTSSSGARFGKAELMSGMNDATPRSDDQVEIWYGAEQVQLRFVNNLALLNFVLTAGDGERVNHRFYNSGVLIFRNERWQALNWHATIKPEER